MQTTTLTLDDGTQVMVPVNLPTQERADYLRELYCKYVVYADNDWKGPNAAVVPSGLAPDVAEAMNFMGATVDLCEPCEALQGMYTVWVVGDHVLKQGEGLYKLYSRGYRAHGY